MARLYVMFLYILLSLYTAFPPSYTHIYTYKHTHNHVHSLFVLVALSRRSRERSAALHARPGEVPEDRSLQALHQEGAGETEGQETQGRYGGPHVPIPDTHL